MRSFNVVSSNGTLALHFLHISGIVLLAIQVRAFKLASGQLRASRNRGGKHQKSGGNFSTF
jgi:hypothetical protein